MEKETIIVTINATYGSKFQREFITTIIPLMLQTLAYTAITHHKKNEFTYTIETKERSSE